MATETQTVSIENYLYSITVGNPAETIDSLRLAPLPTAMYLSAR